MSAAAPTVPFVSRIMCVMPELPFAMETVLVPVPSEELFFTLMPPELTVIAPVKLLFVAERESTEFVVPLLVSVPAPAIGTARIILVSVRIVPLPVRVIPRFVFARVTTLFVMRRVPPWKVNWSARNDPVFVPRPVSLVMSSVPAFRTTLPLKVLLVSSAS